MKIREILKQLAKSNKFVEDFAGFNFEKIEGCDFLYSFMCYEGIGYCYKRDDDRFKYSVAIVLHIDDVNHHSQVTNIT